MKASVTIAVKHMHTTPPNPHPLERQMEIVSYHEAALLYLRRHPSRHSRTYRTLHLSNKGCTRYPAHSPPIHSKTVQRRFKLRNEHVYKPSSGVLYIHSSSFAPLSPAHTFSPSQQWLGIHQLTSKLKISTYTSLHHSAMAI